MGSWVKVLYLASIVPHGRELHSTTQSKPSHCHYDALEWSMSHKARLLTAPVSRLLVNNRSFRLESTCVCYRAKRIRYGGRHPAAFILCRVTSRTQRARCTWIRAAAFFAGWLPLLLHPALRLPALRLENSRWNLFHLVWFSQCLATTK